MSNLIIIRGGSYNSIKKALQQWIDLYIFDMSDDIMFELYEINRDSYIIKANNTLEYTKFCYLVNYLYYPDNIGYEVSVEGFTTATGIKELEGKKVLVYVSDKDTEYDNVCIVTELNEAFMFSFNGTITRIDSVKNYDYPSITLNSRPEIIHIRDNKSESQKRDEIVNKRLKKMLLVSFGAFSISLITSFLNVDIFLKCTLIFNIAFSTGLFKDHELLQINQYYKYCFFLSIVVLCYGILIQQIFSSKEISLFNLGVLLPILLLVIQKPLRYIFKIIFKREPIVDEPPMPLADFIYTILLFAGTGILSAVIGE